MSRQDRHGVSRRTLLGGATAAGAGAVLAAAGPAAAGGSGGRGRISQEAIDAITAQLEQRLIALRHDIHCHPEIHGQEVRTAAVVADQLNASGLRVTTGVGGHGVVGILRGSQPGRTVAYRADIDAVPPAAQIDGVPQPAHVCGHDIHTAVGVGVAQVLARLRHRLAGTVVFFFQPAEESLEGATAMLDDGVLERTEPEEIHALHCAAMPVGQFATTPGTGQPGQDSPSIVLSGPDAVPRADRLAAEIAALNTVPYTFTPESLEQLFADLQLTDGPLAEFIWMRQTSVAEPDADGRVEIDVFYRCWPEEKYVAVRDQIRARAAAYDAAEIHFSEPFPAMICPEREGLAVDRHLREVFGSDAVTTLRAAFPFSGEDFALFLDQLPGTYTFLGVRRPGADILTSYPHFGSFDPDERAIGYGVRAMAGWLAKRARQRCEEER